MPDLKTPHRRRAARRPLALSICCLGVGSLASAIGLMLAPAAHAMLGGARDSIEADRAHMAATADSASAIGFTTNTLTLANGGAVREFARPDGVVFAITWQGPSRPDLRQLLGSYFTILQSDNAPQPGARRLRRPMAVNRSDFIVRTSGHSGAFSGVAYLPGLAPAGFSTSSLR